MPLSETEPDLKTKCIGNGFSRTENIERPEVSLPYVNRVIRVRERIVNRISSGIMDELGYDAELTYWMKKGWTYGK